MFEIDFTLKNETEYTLEIVTLIDGAVEPSICILEPDDEMVHFKPQTGNTTITIRTESKGEK